MIFPYPFFAGALFGALCARRARWLCQRRGARGPVGRDLCANRESKGLDCGVFVVLLRFLNLDLLEVAGTLQRGDEVRHGIDRSRRPFQVYRGAFLRHGHEPEVLRARNRVGYLVQQFLPAGAVALQLLDGGDALLQHRLLLFEGLHLQLDLFQLRLLGP